jgi:hypothetical protein
MSFTLASAMGEAAWLAAGAALGVLAMTLRQKLHAWREQRLAAEWDPY